MQAMSQALLIPDLRHETAAAFRKGLKRCFQVRVSCAMDYQVHAQLQDGRQGLEERIRHLLSGEPADEGDEGPRRSAVEPELDLQRHLADPFAAQIRGVEVRRQHRVDSRIPDGFVNSVEDPRDAAGPRRDYPLQAEAELGFDDLPCVGGAPGDRAGKIVVRYEVMELDWRLSVSDDGIGRVAAGATRLAPRSEPASSIRSPGS